MAQKREKHHNWRGGRTIDPRGYVLIRVGTEHHLSDVRGYAYEHRLVAEKMVGRPLLPAELVHHKDGNKSNNDPVNLEVLSGRAEHGFRHGKSKGRRKLGEENPLVSCACGCGSGFSKYDASGRPRSYVSGHNIQPGKKSND